MRRIYCHYARHNKIGHLDSAQCIQAIIDWLMSDADLNLTEKGIFDCSPIAIAICRNRKILYVNQSFLALFAFRDEGDVKGSDIVNRISEPRRPEVLAKLQPYYQDNLILRSTYESVAARADGVEFPVYVRIEIINLPDGPANSVFIQDITKKKQLEHSLKHQLLSQKFLLELSQLFAQTSIDSIDQTVNQALIRISSAFGADHCAIFEYTRDKSAGSITYECSSGNLTVLKDKMTPIQIESASWLHGQCASQAYFYIPDVADLPDQASRIKHEYLSNCVKTILIVPVMNEGSLYGYLEINSYDRILFFTDEDIVVFKTAANIIANGLSHRDYWRDMLLSRMIYQRFFETGHAKLIVAQDRTIRLANQEFALLTGYPIEAIQSMKLSDFVDSSSADKMAAFQQARISNAQVAPATCIITLRTKNGVPKEVELRLDYLSEKAETLIVFTDLSELRQLYRRLETIRVCNANIIKATSKKELAESICISLAKVGGYHIVWFALQDNDKNQNIRPISIANGTTRDFQNLDQVINRHIQNTEIIRRAINENKIFVERYLKSRHGCGLFNQLRPKYDPKLFCAIPFKVNGNTASGVIGIYSDDEHAFDDRELEMLDDLRLSMTNGINSICSMELRENLNSSLKKSYNEIHSLLLQTVSSLSSVLEFRDPYTSGHQKNVTNLTVSIAREMGLNKEDLETAFVAAALHDIGKISVPSEILSKPGKLSQHEFGIIKDHCQVGYDILKGINFPWPIAKIVYQHHDRLDGSGYPNHLLNQDIHIIARIIAVADTVDAMASHRPYRAALGIESALKEIDAMQGIKYDAAVVQACHHLFKHQSYQLYQD